MLSYMKIYSRRDKKVYRQENRLNMNDVEVLLWNQLRRSQLGYRFRRQHSIGSYIVDFYCPSKKLVIEVDGDSHYEPEAIEYDRCRDDFLRMQNLTIIRFTNLDVRNNLSGVIDAIIDCLTKIEVATPSNSPLGRGRTGNI